MVPENWSEIPVVGSFTRVDGSTPKGYVIFESAQTGVVAGDSVFTPPRVSAKLVNGAIPDGVVLPSTNDEDLNVTGWTYLVTEKFIGGRAPYHIFVPFDSAGIDLATVAPVATPPEMTSALSAQVVAAVQAIADEATATAQAAQGQAATTLQAAQAAATAAQASAQAAAGEVAQLSGYDLAVHDGYTGTQEEWQGEQDVARIKALFAAGGPKCAWYSLWDSDRLYGDYNALSPIEPGDPAVLILDKHLDHARGPTILNNSSLYLSITGWTAAPASGVAGGGTQAFQASLKVTNNNTGTQEAFTYQQVTCEIGVWYEVTFWASSTSAQGRISVGTGITDTTMGNVFSGLTPNQRFMFKATAATMYINARTGSVGAGDKAFFRNIEVRKVLGNVAEQPSPTLQPEYWVEPLTGEPLLWYDFINDTMLWPTVQGALGTVAVAYTTGAQVYDHVAIASIPHGPATEILFFDYRLSDEDCDFLRTYLNAKVVDPTWTGYLFNDRLSLSRGAATNSSLAEANLWKDIGIAFELSDGQVLQPDDFLDEGGWIWRSPVQTTPRMRFRVQLGDLSLYKPAGALYRTAIYLDDWNNGGPIVPDLPLGHLGHVVTDQALPYDNINSTYANLFGAAWFDERSPITNEYIVAQTMGYPEMRRVNSAPPMKRRMDWSLVRGVRLAPDGSGLPYDRRNYMDNEPNWLNELPDDGVEFIGYNEFVVGSQGNITNFLATKLTTVPPEIFATVGYQEVMLPNFIEQQDNLVVSSPSPLRILFTYSNLKGKTISIAPGTSVISFSAESTGAIGSVPVGPGAVYLGSLYAENNSYTDFPAVTYDPVRAITYAIRLYLQNNALAQAAIDNLIDLAMSHPGATAPAGSRLYMNGGTNATPSAGGLAKIVTLRSRGWTVLHN